MSKSIAVFGAGPGLGQAVARRYAREGYAVTLVARRSEPLDRLAKDLTSAGATAHVITADLSDTGATPRLAEQMIFDAPRRSAPALGLSDGVGSAGPLGHSSAPSACLR